MTIEKIEPGTREFQVCRDLYNSYDQYGVENKKKKMIVKCVLKFYYIYVIFNDDSYNLQNDYRGKPNA